MSQVVSKNKHVVFSYSITDSESDPELIFTESLDNVPPQYHRMGAEVEFQNDRGESKTFVASNINEGEITLEMDTGSGSAAPVTYINLMDLKLN